MNDEAAFCLNGWEGRDFNDLRNRSFIIIIINIIITIIIIKKLTWHDATSA